MLNPITSNRFDKDIKKCIKRGLDTKKIRHVMLTLGKQETLPVKYRDHKLVGNYAGWRECHIEPDWLLVYRIEGNNIYFERTGTHADLF